MEQSQSEIQLEPRFKEILECPICTDYFSPPVVICSNGHSICFKCKSSQTECAICRVAYETNSSRNFTVERMLEAISAQCKFEGCCEQITLANRNDHYAVCPFNNQVKCICCGSLEEDLITHLLVKHEYKEINMEEHGGMRSFSGPYDSWVRDTDWPKGIWKFGPDSIIVHAKSSSNVFHIYLYHVQNTPLTIGLSIECGEYVLQFTGRVPHVSEYGEKVCDPHFNCDVGMLLGDFTKVHEEDEEILRLWVKAVKY